ncbi:helix-turn-helix domain-containing protein [Streptomyces niveus]|uniref:helix-turn-helix domain-containing protein n=1 Tax=Streptomyces niveus TaxID=193462 RepID=UPI003646EABB
MTSTAPVANWDGVHGGIQSCRPAFVERTARQLGRLIAQLPETLAVPTAMQTIADWLAQSLDAQVLVTTPDRALAAAPPAAGEHMARAILPQMMDIRSPDNPHTYLTALAPGSTTVLAVASPEPLDEHDERLIAHAAKLLGLVDQARRGIEAAATAAATVGAVVQLLRDGEHMKAGKIMKVAGLPTDLLDSALARVFIIDTPPARRDSTLQRIETATATGRALVTADPDDERRCLVIHPVAPRQTETVTDTLTQLLAQLGPDATLGGSGVHAVDRIGLAYQEALRALRMAGRQPTTTKHSTLADLLPQEDAQNWARELLAPILSLDESERDLLFKDLPVILRCRQKVAADQLHVHRNTISNRLARTERLLNTDLTRRADQAALLLALEVLQRVPDITKLTPVPDDAEAAPTLHALLQSPAAIAWAESLLSPVAQDKYPLLETATVWLGCDAHSGRAASELGISENTVRKYLRRLGEHTGGDLQSLDGVRDLLYAMEILRHSSTRSTTAATSLTFAA